MMCGSKTFLVELELDGIKINKQIIARNAIGARKVIRKEFGADARILSVREEKRQE